MLIARIFRSALVLSLFPSLLGCSSDDEPSSAGGGRQLGPRPKDYPIVQYDRIANAENEDQFVRAFLSLDTGLFTLDVGPHNCDIARSSVKLSDDELARGRTLFSLDRIAEYRAVAGVTYDDSFVYMPPAAPGEKRPEQPPGICDVPAPPDGVYFSFRLPGSYIEWVTFRAGSIPAVATEVTAYMRELELRYHP